MPPNGPDEWRARIGHWENRKLWWYQAHCGSRPRVPLHLHLERVISEAPLLCLLLLLWLSEKVATCVCRTGAGSLGKLVGKARCCRCCRRVGVCATPLLSLFLALSLLLVVAGDVEINPGPISDELLTQVDNAELTGDDLHDIYEEVYTLAAKWSDISFALKLPVSLEETIYKETQGGDPTRCLRMVLSKWLQKCYKYDRYGPPTWRMLVKAVGDPFGVNNCALAETIANKHPEVPDLESQPQAKSAESTAMETPFIGDEEWDPPTEFADMLPKIAKLLDGSANADDLKDFLKCLCHPHACQQRYIDIKFYEHCRTPREIIFALVPQYINFMHTHLLWQILKKFGNDQSMTLLKQYEDRFPHNKPLKRMRDPISDEKAEDCPRSKKIKITCDGGTNVDNTTRKDVERIRQSISRSTGIDECMIVYANQKPGSVIFTFLIPETAVSFFNDLDKESQRDLTDYGIITIEVNGLIIDVQYLQPETKTGMSTYTTSGIKRMPLTHDSPKATHCNSEFQQLISEVETLLAESVDANKLKELLQSFNHILYPEAQYIDPSILKDAESIPQIFTILQPHVINFLNWGVISKAVYTFGIEITSTFQLYESRFPPHTKLSTLPDPLCEEDLLEFRAFQKLRVTCSSGRGIEWTLGDVQAVKEAVETVTGIDQDFIIYAYWEGGFTTHFTFLIPKSISGIFGELCEEDLTILAEKGVQKLEIDYDTVVDNVQKLSKQLPQTAAPIRRDNRMRVKNFGLENFIAKDERISEEEFSHLNNLITNISIGKLDRVCSNDFLQVFAKKMGNWKDLAPYFGINDWDLNRLAEIYPGDEDEQKHKALICWKEIDVNSATYERLVECLLMHGHFDDAEELLLHFQGTEIRKAQDILRQSFQKESFSRRKLWSGAPRLSNFNRSFGIVQNVPVLSELDYTSCYEMMDQFPSEIQKISMKSVLNKITQKETRVFIFKGPPGCGKTELMSRVCNYWARNYGLREYSLVLYVNIWDLNQDCSLQDLINRQFKGSNAISKRVYRWIQEEKGNGVLFLLDGFCCKYLDQTKTNLRSRDILIRYSILSGSGILTKSTVVIATTCSHFVKAFCRKYTQFEILGLSDEQIGKQVIQQFGSQKAVDFLRYLAETPQVKALVSSPSYLIGTMHIFAHISYDDLPETWTQLYTSLIVLVNEWHTRELSEASGTDSLQSQFKNTLIKNGRKVIEDSGDLIATNGESLIYKSEEWDHELPDHNSAVPHLELFLSALETLLNPDYNKVHKVFMGEDAFAYFWYFFAGLGVEAGSKKLLKQYYQKDILEMTNCLFETGHFTVEHQTDLSSLTAEVSQRVLTTHDIHSILHCLPYLQDSHTVVLNNCFLGTQAVRELSRFLAADSWSNDHSGITHLCLELNRIGDSGATALADALRVNQSLKILTLQGNRIGDSGALALVNALRVNQSLETLNLERNEIRYSGATELADALRVNQSLKTLNLKRNGIEDYGATALADALRVNQSLNTLNLERNGIGYSGATALADALRANQILERLNLEGNGIGNSGATALANVLRVNRSLKTLYLKRNGIGDSGATALADALRANQILEILNLEGNGIGDYGATALAGALRVNWSLKALYLERNGIGDSGATALANVLRVNWSLKTLCLERNGIGDSGATALADALRANQILEILNLEGNGIGDHGATALAGALRVNRSLKILDLEWNRIGESGATALADALRVNQILEILNLEGNGIIDSGVTALADALSEFEDVITKFHSC